MSKKNYLAKSKVLGALCILYYCNPYLTFFWHDGGLDAADIPTDIPPGQLKQLMMTTYKTEVVVDETKANKMQLLMMHDDEDASTIWLCERRQCITSSSAGSIAKR